ncbi:MAG: hypothetical protein JRI55_30535, partial [Deltaproteobacteria bacterium]|nr:hypothetical protein [Deltaproteobacteria bacterium]
RGSGSPALLLVIAHHLVMDVVSWGVLLEDLEVGYRQARAGEPVSLPPRTTSFRDWVAFLEPSSSRNMGIPTRLSRRPYADVVYAPHSYDAQAEQGSGFAPDRRAAVINNISGLAEEAREMGAALWIGEYGGVASDPGIGAYMDAQYDGAAAVCAGSMYWDYTRDDGYGLLEPSGDEKPALLEVLVRPYPARVAGDPISFEFDEASRTFGLAYRPAREIGAPTEIVVPARVYPSGYRVECGGCRFERAEGRLLLTHPGPAAVETVTLRPAGP